MGAPPRAIGGLGAQAILPCCPCLPWFQNDSASGAGFQNKINGKSAVSRPLTEGPQMSGLKPHWRLERLVSW